MNDLTLSHKILAIELLIVFSSLIFCSMFLNVPLCNFVNFNNLIRISIYILCVFSCAREILNVIGMKAMTIEMCKYLALCAFLMGLIKGHNFNALMHLLQCHCIQFNSIVYPLMTIIGNFIKLLVAILCAFIILFWNMRENISLLSGIVWMIIRQGKQNV